MSLSLQVQLDPGAPSVYELPNLDNSAHTDPVVLRETCSKAKLRPSAVLDIAFPIYGDI
ncbi:hypothetical protein GSI_04545 [Ganoderma sinense ZZ0214-1]|uniref:Uncharacterized protein n=1 Tax=Ganoderma sinense ZZ0214-1 TaxID=1077348 RepID=A0A2G8SH61_9APHY|nr:hypothetical protein GSI_04545 [Ganoderma sinense ZZ0214-1]